MLNGIEKYLQNDSDHVFLMDEKTGLSYTYKMIHDSARQIGGYFIHLGLKKDDRIAIVMDNSVMLAKIYFACLYAGVTVVPVNAGWTEEQIQFVLTDSHARLLLTSSQYSKKMETSGIALIVIPENEAELNFDGPAINPADYLRSDNVAIIIYTSGTTSMPKGVIHTLSDLVGNGLLFTQAMGISNKNRFYNILPMTYLGGYYNLLLIPYLAKASVVIASAFNAHTIVHFWQGVMKHEINTLWLVPTMMAILMEIDRNSVAAEYCMKHILLTLVGTAPLPAKLKHDFEIKYGIFVRENYGLSETLFIATHLINEPAGGVGNILNGISVKIIDDKNNILAHEEEGEIIVNTPFVMNAYTGHQSVFIKGRDEWFYTGDLGKIDQHGSLHITGRKKDLIIRGGINISPASIEDVLYRHNAVQECAVVGTPHDLSGEEIIAVVKVKEDIQLEAIKPELIQLCKEHLSAVQQPADIVQLEELPHTYTGKIQKEKLRAWLKNNKTNARQNKKVEKEANFYKPSHIASNSIQALSIAYNTMVYELQSKNIDVTVLSLGEAFFDLPLFNFNALPYPASYHYSHSRGVPKLRQVLAEYFLNQYDVKFNPENEIIITAGSKIAIYMTLMAIINPGDEVIIHDPAWVSYPEQIKLCHGVPVQVPYHETVYDFEKYITNRTKVLIVNNPNNPKGSVLTLDEIAHLYKLAEKYHLYILSDEAYSDFVINKEQFISIGNFDKEMKFSIICNSISKNFGISGWRIGYVIANPALIDQILKLNQHLITCPATILEHYIANHFYDILKVTKPQIHQLLNKRANIIAYIKELGLSCLEGSSTFYIFLSIADSCLNSNEFCHLLLNKHRICVVPGIGYGNSCDKFVRVSIGSESIERIFAALDTIKEVIQMTNKLSKLDVFQTEKQAISMPA